MKFTRGNKIVISYWLSVIREKGIKKIAQINSIIKSGKRKMAGYTASRSEGGTVDQGNLFGSESMEHRFPPVNRILPVALMR